MKKLLLLCLCSTVVMAAQAQVLKPELELGYGKWTTPVIGNEVKNDVNNWLHTNSGTTNVNSSGAFQSGLYLSLLKISVGAVGSFEKINVAEYHSGGSSTTRNSYWTVMGRLRWNYLGALNIHLYGAVAGGFSYLTSTVTGASGDEASQMGDRFKSQKIAYQITPLGIMVGNKFGVFAEVGYGYLGVVNGGIRLKF